MKNLFLSTVLAFIALFQLQAQNSSMILGLKGGANFSKLSYTGDYSFQGEKTGRRLGFNGGVDIGVKFNSFSFLTGLSYNQRGGATEYKNVDPNNPFTFADGSFDTGTYNSKTRLTQLSIPLLLRYTTSGKIAFSLTVGPSINLGIGSASAEESFDLDNIADKGPTEYKLTFGDSAVANFKKSKMGFIFSPGILYKINDNGYLRFNFIIESGGNIANPNLSIGDGLGNFREVQGSIKSSSMIFEIGYEHRIDFNMGSKY